MSDLQQFKCPNCGGSIEFDSHTGKPKCPYCGTEFEVETLKSYENVLKETDETEVDFETERAGQQWNENEKLRTYVCKNCGGSIITDNTTAAQCCPYCGSAVVINNNLQGNLKPDLVVPFKLDKQQAMEAFANHMKNKPLLPRMFKETNLLETIKGVYVPFWLYDAEVDASARFKGTRTRHYSDRDYEYTETSYYSIYRSAEMGFDNVPVDGSTKVDSVLMESIEPFNIKEAVDFQTAYLAGYFADKYDINSEKSASHAYSRIKHSATDALESTVTGFDSVMTEGIRINLQNSDIKYVLLPVWLLTTNYAGKQYTFAMNGQTGKFVGDLPTDDGAFWTMFLTRFAGIGAITYGLQWLVKLFLK